MDCEASNESPLEHVLPPPPAKGPPRARPDTESEPEDGEMLFDVAGL